MLRFYYIYRLALSYIFRRDGKQDVPRNAVGACLICVLLLVHFSFEAIQKMSNVLSAMSQLLILFAIVKLRISHPYINRPFKCKCKYRDYRYSTLTSIISNSARKSSRSSGLCFPTLCFAHLRHLHDTRGSNSAVTCIHHTYNRFYLRDA